MEEQKKQQEGVIQFELLDEDLLLTVNATVQMSMMNAVSAE